MKTYLLYTLGLFVAAFGGAVIGVEHVLFPTWLVVLLLAVIILPAFPLIMWGKRLYAWWKARWLQHEHNVLAEHYGWVPEEPHDDAA